MSTSIEERTERARDELGNRFMPLSMRLNDEKIEKRLWRLLSLLKFFKF
jgi:hypothetical protein